MGTTVEAVASFEVERLKQRERLLAAARGEDSSLWDAWQVYLLLPALGVLSLLLPPTFDSSIRAFIFFLAIPAAYYSASSQAQRRQNALVALLEQGGLLGVSAEAVGPGHARETSRTGSTSGPSTLSE